MIASINSADYINIKDTLIKSNYSSIKHFNLTDTRSKIFRTKK